MRWLFLAWLWAVPALAQDLGDLGTWALGDGWTIAEASDIPAREGTGGVGWSLTHPTGKATAVVLRGSQTLSLKAMSQGQLTPEGHRPPEPAVQVLGELAWWHARSDLGVAMTTGLGGVSVAIIATPSVTDEAIVSLAQGLELTWTTTAIDEAWATFELPSNVAWVHDEAAPYSYTRGNGIVAVDVTFDRNVDVTYEATEDVAVLAARLDGWSVVSGSVAFDFEGNRSLVEMEAWDTDANSKASIAAPGSNLGARVVAAIRRNGVLRLEVRAEGDDAPVLAHNDLVRIASTATAKDRYDWFYDARRLRRRQSRDQLAAMFEEAGPLAESALQIADTFMASNGSMTATASAGISAAQMAPTAYFALFELGKSKSPTEDPTVVNVGYTRSDYSLVDYFGEGSDITTRTAAFGVHASAGARVFKQRAWYGVNYQLVWPQNGANTTYTEAAAPPASISNPHIQPFIVKMRTGMNIDPFTHLFPHRLGSFGDFRMGIGLGNTIDMVRAKYDDGAGEQQQIFYWNVAFVPTAGFQLRLFWDALFIYGDGYYNVPQMNLFGFYRDSAAASILETEIDAGRGPSSIDAFVKAGTAGMMSRAVGSALPRGGYGAHVTAVVGIPFRARATTKPNFAIAKGQGAVPPLGGKVRRSLVRSSIGVGVTWFIEETRFEAMAKPWGPEQSAFSTVNTGFIIGGGFGNVNLPAFGSGRR